MTSSLLSREELRLESRMLVKIITNFSFGDLVTNTTRRLSRPLSTWHQTRSAVTSRSQPSEPEPAVTNLSVSRPEFRKTSSEFPREIVE
jgi:hypothetical protein